MRARFRSWWQNIRSRLRSWWQQIKKHWVPTIIIVFVGVIVFIVLGYLFKLDWTGFNSGTSQITITSASKGTYTASVPQPSKSLWDWLQLLIVPAILAIGGYLFNRALNRNQQAATEDTQREAALQAYIDKISELLLKEHLGERTADGKLKPKYEQVRKVARVRTITVLTQLSARRIGYVFAFLREAELMSTTSNDNVVSLSLADFHAVNWSQADISSANLFDANLRDANLSGANLSNANLRKADLIRADLWEAGLQGVNLSKAKFIGAYLSGALLSGVNLRRANLGVAKLSEAVLDEANLRRAYIGDADLSGANLRKANLSGADLSNANLEGVNLNKAWVTREQLTQAKSLKGAIMPDGKMYRNSSGANLRKADLSGANLNGADLRGADLSGAEYNNIMIHAQEEDIPGIKLTQWQGARYNTRPIQEKDIQGNLITLEPTQWTKEFDPKVAGAICDDC